ncbi:MAG: hypothetical protein ACRDT5_12125 [Mycobacterium sp.]
MTLPGTGHCSPACPPFPPPTISTPTARLVPLSGRVDPAAVEDVLERAAADIEKLSRIRTITAIKETSK